MEFITLQLPTKSNPQNTFYGTVPKEIFVSGVPVDSVI